MEPTRRQTRTHPQTPQRKSLGAWEQRLLAAHRDLALLQQERFDEASLVEAMLEALGRRLGFAVVEYWRMAAAGQGLCQAETWCERSEFERWVALAGGLLLAPGSDWVGRCWAQGRLLNWTEPIPSPGGPRDPLAAELGLRAGLACPVRHAGKVVGVLLMMSEAPQLEDPSGIQELAASLGVAAAALGAAIELRHQIRHNQGLFDAAPYGVALLDRAARAQRVNRRLCAMLGQTELAITRLTLADWVDAEHSQTVQAQLEELWRQQREEFEQEVRIQTLDGRMVWVKLGARLIADEQGEPLHVLAVIEDVTDRKRADEELTSQTTTLRRAFRDLRAQNERIEAEVSRRTRELELVNRRLRAQAKELAEQGAFVEGLIRQLPGALAFVDTELQLWRFNDEFAARLSMGSRAALGHSIVELLPFAADHLAETLRECLDSGRPAVLSALPWPADDGAPEAGFRDLLINPVVDDDGAVTGILLLAIDVTPRMQLDRLQKSQIDALRQADELKSQFLNMVSHEFRTPLTVIMGATDVLKVGIVGPVAQRQERYLEKIAWSARSLMNLVNDLLAMSQIQAGRLKLIPSEVDLDELIAHVIGLLKPLARERSLTIAHHPLPEPLRLVADERRLTQVLLNLLSNAIKFSEPNGRIELATRLVPEGLRCGVLDQGIGIAAHQIPRLFRSFVQLAPAEAAGGTGLGLSICKAFIEAHGGHIGVESTLGQGSEFWFVLPVSPPPR